MFRYSSGNVILFEYVVGTRIKKGRISSDCELSIVEEK